MWNHFSCKTSMKFEFEFWGGAVQAETDKALRPEPKVEFSGEEVGGRYLDLHEHYRRFLNLKVGRKLEYPEYVSLFAHFDDIPRHKRISHSYRWGHWIHKWFESLMLLKRISHSWRRGCWKYWV